MFQLTWEGVDAPVRDLGYARVNHNLDEGAFSTLEPGQSRWVVQ